MNAMETRAVMLDIVAGTLAGLAAIAIGLILGWSDGALGTACIFAVLIVIGLRGGLTRGARPPTGPDKPRRG